MLSSHTMGGAILLGSAARLPCITNVAKAKRPTKEIAYYIKRARVWVLVGVILLLQLVGSARPRPQGVLSSQDTPHCIGVKPRAILKLRHHATRKEGTSHSEVVAAVRGQPPSRAKAHCSVDLRPPGRAYAEARGTHLLHVPRLAGETGPCNMPVQTRPRRQSVHLKRTALRGLWMLECWLV